MYICSMKPLRSKLLCLLFLAGSICGHARTVISQSTREPIVYAGVGVINRNLGTVTDTSGHFSLKIPAEFINDSIRISSVGYVARTFAVRDIATIPDTIALADDVIMLREVVVKPHRIKHLTTGRKGCSGFTILTDNRLLSRMKFRVNVYLKEQDAYVLQKIAPVYFGYDKSRLVDGEFSYTFPEEIMPEPGNYYIELEFLENFSREHFTMKTRPLTGKTRYASQSDGATLPFGAPIHITYDSVE